MLGSGGAGSWGAWRGATRSPENPFGPGGRFLLHCGDVESGAITRSQTEPAIAWRCDGVLAGQRFAAIDGLSRSPLSSFNRVG
jgi:hypothetical protein